MRPQFWSRAWQTYPWLRLLSGVTCEPSTVQRGADQWIASLADTPASPSPTPADVVAWMTSGTCGPKSRASSESVEQVGLFLRTCPAILPSVSTMSAATFKAWASGLRQEYSARLKLVRRTVENGCSSWPTARTSDTNGAGEHGDGGADLRTVASNWPTATTFDTMEARRKGIVGNHNLSLPAASQDWQTPSAGQHSKRRQVGQVERKELLLPAQAEEAWATPTARDHKDGADPSANVATNSLLGRQAPRATGAPSPSGSGPRRLNPAFVEWLMGLPAGWTDFGPVETEYCLWQQLMRSELSRLPWLEA